MTDERVCAECGGTWSDTYRRIYHRFTCSQNPLFARRRASRAQPSAGTAARSGGPVGEDAVLPPSSAPSTTPEPDPDLPEECPHHPGEPKYECRPCEIWSERAWEERHIPEPPDEPD